MLRSVLLGTACAVAMVSSAHAGEDSFSGPYVGIQGGYTSYSIELSAEGDSIDLDADGVEGGVYAGYGRRFGSQFYAAVEADGSLSNAEYSVPGVSIETNYNLGISAIAGVVVTDKALVYGRVGYRYLDASASADGELLGDEQFHGLRLGLGAAVELGKNTHARAEASYTFYDKYTEDGGSLQPSQLSFMFGLHYTF
jgi:outer membrane immunogenic protein